MNMRTTGFIVLALILSAGQESLVAQEPNAVSSSGMVMIDGIPVPDIGPMPAFVPMPPGNVNYVQKIELGKQLYFDGRLSKNNAISCAFCHNPGTGFADARQFSIGAFGTAGGRQAPTVYNTAFNPLQFWDGRATSLEEQAIGPIHNPIEMAETHETVVPKIAKIPGYQKQFKAVFGHNVSLQGIADAIAAFERTIVSANSAFDKYVMGESNAMDDSAVRGLQLFKGKARCVLCHNGPNFTDNQFHNLGVPQEGLLKEDVGRYNVTRRERDKGAFKTPTLRSITETAPYMHDGVFKTLEDVIEFKDKGGQSNSHLSPLMQPLGLAPEEKADLIAFLKALAGAPLKITVPKLPK
ncbi:MAG TPA: cytochrome c peroxidase [Nitrospiraceae bacterium]|nr:cytochrome c peroxidase [Nitrospiraceae bacterium]